jgi:hypothetical protein
MQELAKGLAERINVEHRAVEEAARSAVEHAIVAGDLLNDAKEQLGHGEFGPWLLANFEGSRQTADIYRKLAAHKDELSECQRASNLSIRGALRELEPAREDGPAEQTTGADDVHRQEPMHALVHALASPDGVEDWDFERDVPLTKTDVEYLARVVRSEPEVGRVAAALFFGDEPCVFPKLNPHGVRDPYTAVLLGRVRKECGEFTYLQLFEQIKLDDTPLIRHDPAQLKHLLSLAHKGEPDEETAEIVAMVGWRWKIRDSVAQLSYLGDLCESGVSDEETAELVRTAKREGQSLYTATRRAVRRKPARAKLTHNSSRR